MEQRTKPAAGFLGMCIIFMAFAGVSMKISSPELLTDSIASSLDWLHEELEPMVNGSNHFTVEAPTKRAWQSNEECAGTFTVIFKKATQTISNRFPGDKIRKATNRIISYLKSLIKYDCPQLKRLRHQACKKETHEQTVLYFFKQFISFTREILKKTCG